MSLSLITSQDCIPVGCIPPACWPYLPACTAPGGCACSGGVPAPGCVPAKGWGCLVLGGVCSQGVSATGGGCLLLEGVSAPGVVPCGLSCHAFDVTCMLPPHQLRHINSAPAYILLPGHVTCKACWDTPPPHGQTDTCKNITFANYFCGR